MAKRQASLSQLLAYRNPEVVARFSIDLKVSKAFANTVFEDLLRYLYLMRKVKRKRESKSLGLQAKRALPAIVITDQMLILDEMWHTFILYTTEYTEFSIRYFGEFVHHFPNPTWKKRKVSDLNSRELLIYRQEIEVYMEMIYDELGSEVLERWFVTYPRKFDDKKILQRKLKALGAA